MGDNAFGAVAMKFDTWLFRLNNISMSIDTSITAEAMVEMQLAADRAANGVRDPEAMRRAVERMDRNREALRKKVGELNVAVDLIRSARDE